MKKSLSVLLSVAMSASIFASVAFGADANLDTQAKYDALVQQKIFDGFEDGQAHLDQTMTRAQFAKTLALTFGLQETTGSSYTDLDGAGWAAGYIEAVTKAGLMDGMAPGIFDPSGNVTLEQLAKVLVAGFKLQQTTEGVTGTVSDWAKGYVGAALKAGLISSKSDYTKPALRSDLVDSIYTAVQKVAEQNEATATFKATGAKQLQVAFSKAVDTSKVTFEVKYGTAPVTPKVTWSDDKKTASLNFDTKLQAGEYNITVKGAASKDLSGKVTVEDEKVAKIEIASDTAPSVMEPNTYKIQSVNVYYKVLNQYNEDITKTSSITWQSSIGPVSNDDTQQGIVTFNIPDNNYYFQIGTQFTINGYIPGTNVSINKTMKIGDVSKANSVTVKELWSADGKPLTVTMNDYSGYYLLMEVKDQYGNPVKAKDLTGKDGQLLVNSSMPTLLNVVDSNYDPHFFDNVGPNADQLGLQLVKPDNQGYISGDTKVTITLSPKYGGTSTSYTIELKKGSIVQNFSLSQPTVTVARGDKVTIPYTATDADGNAVTDLEDLAYDYNGKTNYNGVNLTSNLSPVNGKPAVRWEKDESTGKAIIRLDVPDNAPDTIYVNAFVQSTAKNVQLPIQVRDAKYPAAVTSWTIKPALAVTKDNGVVTGKAQVRLEGEFTKVQDQYGNNMTMDNANFFKDYAIRVQFANTSNVAKIVKYGDGATVVDSTYNTYLLNNKDSYVDFEAQDLGSVNVRLDVVYNNHNTKGKAANQDVEIPNQYGTVKNYTKISVKDLPLQVVNLNDISTFEIADIAKLYDNKYDADAGRTFATNNKDVDVYGKLGSGTKVALPANSVTLRASSGLKIVDNAYPVLDKVQANGAGVPFTGSDVETKGYVTATIIKSNDTLTVNKELTVSRATPVLTKIVTENEITNNQYIYKYVDGVWYIKASSINGYTLADGLLKHVLFRDQYDITQSTFKLNSSVTFSQVEGIDLGGKYQWNATDTFSGAVDGQTKFTMVVTGDNGVIHKARVVVVSDPGQY